MAFLIFSGYVFVFAHIRCFYQLIACFFEYLSVSKKVSKKLEVFAKICLTFARSFAIIALLLRERKVHRKLLSVAL